MKTALLRYAFGAGLVLACVLMSTGVASADGAKTIAGAPAIVYGQQEFGNTANGSDEGGCLDGYYHSYWTLNVTSGDSVTIDWEATPPSEPMINIYPVGTTDFNVGNTDADPYQSLNDNDRNELAFSAPTTGAMPVDFSADDGCDVGTGDSGPYGFTAYVEHAVLLALPPLGSLPLSGRMSVGVHNPDGGPISDPGATVALQIRAPHQSWITVGRASPVAGAANIAYSVPGSLAGQNVSIRAVASGAAYTTATSTTSQVTVQEPRPAPRPRTYRPHLSHLGHSGRVLSVRASTHATVEFWVRRCRHHIVRLHGRRHVRTLCRLQTKLYRHAHHAGTVRATLPRHVSSGRYRVSARGANAAGRSRTVSRTMVIRSGRKARRAAAVMPIP